MQSWSHIVLTLGVGFVVSCAGVQKAPGSGQPTNTRSDSCEAPHDEGHAVEVYLSAQRGDGPRAVCPGEPLASGDPLLITVELERASHVRMVFVSPDGQAGELTRRDHDETTRVAEFRAPEGLLAGSPGDAQLFVVASRTPLDQSDPGLSQVLDSIRDTGTLVDEDGRVHTAKGSEAAHGFSLDFAPEALHADFDAHGVAMLVVSLRAAP